MSEFLCIFVNIIGPILIIVAVVLAWVGVLLYIACVVDDRFGPVAAAVAYMILALVSVCSLLSFTMMGTEGSPCAEKYYIEEVKE